MTHVAKAHVRLALDIIALCLSLNNTVGDLTSLEEIDRERAIETSVHGTIENLLHDIIHNIVQEVVPGEAKEEILCQTSASAIPLEGDDTHKNGRDDVMLNEHDLQIVSNDRPSVYIVIKLWYETLLVAAIGQ